MEDTFACPKCQAEYAYQNGLFSVCIKCNYDWSDASNNLSLGNKSKFEFLAKLKAPFFKLEHGKLYDCRVEHNSGIEDISIIPLAFKKGANLQFLMTDARRLIKENLVFVRDIIQMEYDYIYNDGIRDDYPFDYEALTINSVTQKDGTILGYGECVFFDFKITEEI